MSASETIDKGSCLIFKLNDDGNGPELLKEVLYDKGWIDHNELIHNEFQWNLWWKTMRFRTSEYDQLCPWQRINHCPKATGITRKDSLARLLKLQQALFGSAYNFVPQSYILPNDYRKFVEKFSSGLSTRKKLSDGAQYWICKPADMSRGRGIFIIRELGELQYDTNSVVQHYVSQPYLIHGHKFDLRLYAVVMSYHPLVIYLYDDGLVRFSCEKYDLSALDNVYSHLTNTSINKTSFFYSADKAGIGHGSKWTLKQLRHFFHQSHVDDSDLWWKIISIVNLTIIPQISEVPKVNNCFELYGFDILIDRDLKPWLLEVNFSPSLSSDCSADAIKKEMLSDLIDLLHYQPSDHHPGFDPYLRKSSSSFSRSYSKIPDRVRNPVSRCRLRPRAVTTPTRATLPKIVPSNALLKARLCHSAIDSPDTCGIDEENNYKRRSQPHNYPANNILTCSLSNVNLPHPAGAFSTRRSQSGTNKLVPRISSSQVHHKPWRQQCRKIEPDNPQTSNSSKPVVGGFHRVFPFNAVTKTRTLSPRQMVIESQQMIRSKLKGSGADGKKLSSTARVTTSNLTDITSPFPDLT